MPTRVRPPVTPASLPTRDRPPLTTVLSEPLTPRARPGPARRIAELIRLDHAPAPATRPAAAAIDEVALVVRGRRLTCEAAARGACRRPEVSEHELARGRVDR